VTLHGRGGTADIEGPTSSREIVSPSAGIFAQVSSGEYNLRNCVVRGQEQE
jgi:hypothetical protein